MSQLQTRSALPAFEPARHEPQLVAILRDIAREERWEARSLDRILRRHPKDGVGFFSRADLIAGVRRFAGERLPLGEAQLLERLRVRPVRTQSGVTPITVLTKPFPCPGRCIFCPSDVRMPKSYLCDEPGAQRAAYHAFDPYRQTWSRLEAYRTLGHPVDKAELIVLGGTWSFYPERYQVWYAKRCFDALNDFGKGIDRRGEAAPVRRGEPARSDGPAEAGAYNRIVRRRLAGEGSGERLVERASWEELERAQRENETAGCRSVGLSFETRPDHVSPAEVLRLRRLGATKLQIGIQSLSDRVLEANRRGHDVAATRRALRWLRAAGFKIQAHWMANLFGSSAEEDLRDFARLFDDPAYRPDELKIYPCSLIESAELMAEYERGAWRPYGEEDLLRVLTACLERSPPYCRLSRVIRDFSAGDIVAGSRTANLREVAERRLRQRGGASREIRSREVRGRAIDAAALELRALAYETSIGREIFLEFATPEDRLVAFLRLALPGEPSFVEELGASALIRELHVYGASLALKQRRRGGAQHAGLGRRLVEEAKARARRAGFRRVAVISAVGTREYYRALGFRDGELYQHASLI